jgi:uncharacterized membrane protein YuzA (DUF378 family)
MASHELLSQWENFFIIVGSSAGALTGLQFVVMALVAESRAAKDTREVDAFGTPTIVHFCVVLLVSAILSAPWPDLWQVAAIVGILGVLGIGYMGIVVRRTRRTVNYKPELEDWIWHCVLPLVAYILLLAAAATLQRIPLQSLFGIATFSLLLLFIGIRNAWDTVTYVAVGLHQPPPGP